jgi:hypothetical protein
MQRQLAELVAKDQIRDGLYRYARGVDRTDVELLKSCYHPDGVDAHWNFIGNGHEFAEEILAPHQMGAVPVFKHFITNVLIEIEGDRAFCESSYLFSQTISLTAERQATLTSEGRYLDVFECRNGEWRIWRRLLVPESGNWTLPVPAPAPDGLPLPTLDQCVRDFPDDPVYRGFDLDEVMPEHFRTDRDTWAPTIDYLRGLVTPPE